MTKCLDSDKWSLILRQRIQKSVITFNQRCLFIFIRWITWLDLYHTLVEEELFQKHCIAVSNCGLLHPGNSEHSKQCILCHCFLEVSATCGCLFITVHCNWVRNSSYCTDFFWQWMLAACLPCGHCVQRCLFISWITWLWTMHIHKRGVSDTSLPLFGSAEL